MKKTIGILIILLITISNREIFGMNENTTTQKIIGAIKNHELSVLEELGKSVQEQDIIHLQNMNSEIKEISLDIEKLLSQFNEIGQKRKETNEKITLASEEIKKIILTIREKEKIMSNSMIKLKLYVAKILSLQKTSKDLEKDLEISKEYVAKFTILLYKLNNEVYSDGNIDNIKLLLRTNDNIASTLSREDLIKILTNTLKDTLQSMKKQYDNLIGYTIMLNELKMNYLNEIKQYRDSITTLKEQRKTLRDFIILYKVDKAELEGELKNLFETRGEVRKKIEIMIKKIQQQQIIGAELFSGKIVADQEDTNRFLSRPIYPIESIKNFFGEEKQGSVLQGTQSSISFSISQGNNVYSPAPGIVLYAKQTSGMQISRIAILHPYGYISVLKPLNHIYVKPGDIIKRGMLIGISGGEPGTFGAGIDSESPHLEYTVFKNGNPIDPLLVSDTSMLSHHMTLPERYQKKLFVDVAIRQKLRDFDSLGFMTGDTVEERRYTFLYRYATFPYNNPKLRETAARETDIDIDLGICIGFAESTLGKYLKTEANIGNVGNNDRGDTVTFISPLDGIRAIYYTLNNRFLSGYQTTFDLSGFGNKSGPVYASSPYNRQNNIIKCLSSIKGYYVPERFPFRIGISEPIQTSYATGTVESTYTVDTGTSIIDINNQ